MGKLRDEKGAAEFLGCTVSALRKWRLLENGPVYVKVGSPLTRLGKTIFLWLRGYQRDALPG